MPRRHLPAFLPVFALFLAAGCSRQEPPAAPSPAPAETRSAAVDDSDAAAPDATAPEGQATSPPGSLADAAESAPAGGDSAPYWPRFHGPRGNNISSDTGLLKEWPEEGPPLEWTAQGIGNGYSSVSLAHGLIFTAGNLNEKTVITALDLDGNLRWQVENGPAWTKSYAGTRGTPTVDGDRLYHQSPLGNLLCMNAKTGEPIWTTNTLEMFQAENIEWALAESLLIDGDHVICCPGGKLASVAALNKMNGEVVWTAESTGEKTGYATPILAEYQGLRMIITMNAKAVLGVNADTGQLLFRDPYETQYDVNAAMPIFHDGCVFVSTGYKGTGARLLRLIVQGQQVQVEHVWESDNLDNQHGGVLLLDGYLYGAAHQFNNGKWVCLSWDRGEMQWAEREVGMGSLTFADGLFYLYSEKRQVGLARLTPEKFELISQFRLPAEGSGASWAHPVVCGGRLYLRYDDSLLAYRVKAE